MFWQKSLETMDREALRALQLKRLQWTVKHCYEDVPFYRKRLDEAGVRPEDIRSLEDLRLIPMTDKCDVRDQYPYGMFACSMKDIVRIQGSSGTTGKPTIVGYTRNDLNTWTDLVARLLTAVGVTNEDVAQVAFGYGLFTGAHGLHQALDRIGCAVIPISSGNTQRQIMLMQDLGTTVLISTPSYALYLAENIEKMGLKMGEDIKLRVGCFGGEATSDMMRDELHRRMGILATDNYGMSELIGPGVAGECIYQQGMHIQEDCFIAEIVDPQTLKPLPVGEVGELVVTPLFKEAMPILRYRTHDITRLDDSPCACGRTFMRMDKLHGRSDDMLVIRGVNVFPGQVETVIAKFPEIGPNYEIDVTRDGMLDKMEIRLELTDASLLEKYALLENLERRLSAQMHAILGLDAKIRLVEPFTLKRFEGKARRVNDMRNIYKK